MGTELYRQTKFGDSLVSALEELVDSDKIAPDLAIKVLSEVSALTQPIWSWYRCGHESDEVCWACSLTRYSNVLLWFFQLQ